jgi:hypothetical protein
MKIKSALLGAALAGLWLASPAGAAVIYQSIPDLTIAPVTNAWCSQCGGDGQSIGQAFSLGSTATAGSVSFTVQSDYFWPTSVTVGIYQDAGGSVGTSLYNNTFTSFASDVPTANNTDVVTVSLTGGVSLAAGNYVIFLTNPGDLGIPGYSGGAGNQIVVQGSSSPLLTGDSYYYLSAGSSDTAVSIGTGVPEASTWLMMLAGFAGLGFVGYRRNKLAFVAA